MGLDLPGLDNGESCRTDLEETRVKGIRERDWGSKKNRNGFLEITPFEEIEDGVRQGFGTGGLSLGLVGSAV